MTFPAQRHNLRPLGCVVQPQELPYTLIPHSKKPDTLYWILALLFAAVAGYTHVRIDATGLSVLMVTGFAMFLAYRCPQRVIWWAVIMGLSLPVAVLLSYLSDQKPTLGIVGGSFAGIAFSIVAAVGGTVLRRVVLELFPSKAPPAPND